MEGTTMLELRNSLRLVRRQEFLPCLSGDAVHSSLESSYKRTRTAPRPECLLGEVWGVRKCPSRKSPRDQQLAAAL
ncbi:unnamed protein product [Callosobruchus maculatus]|uniref:Uncharacterized protein n=1 Tax=Callosobruchus maculatus TaxID=64391 RepID=A0A653CAW2_CALMS|nr:unnamed protein product [Callosobruchus maculatus]